MRRTRFDEMHCSVAQALEVVGEWWTPLIVRDLLLGVRRFDDLQRRLGIARNVLTTRLQRLVDEGVVERRRYQTNPERHEYRLTDKGRDLWVVIAALRQWGDRWAAPDGPPVVVVHETCGEVVDVVPACSHCGETLERSTLRAIDGPGAASPGIVPTSAPPP